MPPHDSSDSSAADGATAPTVVVLTDDLPAAERSVPLPSLFEGYPSGRVLHVGVGPGGQPVLRNATSPGSLDRADVTSVSAGRLTAQLAGAGRRIDLVYANVSGAAGLGCLIEIATSLPAAPVVCHVRDVLATDDILFDALLRALSTRVDEYWASGTGIAARIRQATRRDAIVMPPIACELLPVFKTDHATMSEAFTAVVLGMPRRSRGLDAIAAAWGEVQRRYGVGPIRLFAHPDAVREVEAADALRSPGIEYCGYLSGRLLHAQLCAADLAIVPFNTTDEPEGSATRHGIPAALGPCLSAGVPIFAAAGRHTELRRFITEHGIGRCSTPADEAGFTSDLVAFAADARARELLGRAGRRFASACGDVADYRARAIARLRELARRAAVRTVAA